MKRKETKRFGKQNVQPINCLIFKSLLKILNNN